jgi:general L-amino acid transport system substrate-binding protein
LHIQVIQKAFFINVSKEEDVMIRKKYRNPLAKVGILIFSVLVFSIFISSCGESEKVSELEKKASELGAKVAELQKKNAELEKKTPSAAIPAGKTLEAVRSKGYISVGVNEGLFGFSKPDEKGEWRGLDVETARAISVAVFGAPDKLKFVPLTAKTRFTALQSGEIDVLTRNCTQTLGRETSLGLAFAHVNYYDGQGFLVPKKLGVKSAKELDGATVCVLPGTTTELNLADYFRANNMKMKPVVIESTPELAKAFFAGRCDVLTSDASQLASTRTVAPNPDDYMILPEIISKEPLAPAVRHGDDQWYDIVNFSVLAMVAAEELGITSKNVDQMLESKDPKIQRFLGVTPGNGKALGLDEKWAYNIIKLVGNYGEVFERNVGVNTPLKLARGLNEQWTKGGLMYAPPFK